MQRLSRTDYRKKLEACFVGKSVGGTLGGPYEGEPGPLALTYYDPVPDEMLPNDDLDLQVVWLEIIRRKGLPIHRGALASGWLENIHMFPDEYAVAHRNILRGIFPPMSGAFDNDFTSGMGAAIRSEIWACLAPGCPDLAVRLAREDACADHDGDGVDACVFFAALESMAFVEEDRDAMLAKAFSYLPENSRVGSAMKDTIAWWAQSGDWLAVRQCIRDRYAMDNWTDVAMNLAYIVLGWLAGEGDFGKSILVACNCGGDTDCTAATLGALLGLIAPDSMGEEWTGPIGRDLVLSPSMAGMHPCATLDAFCDQIEALTPQVLRYYGADLELEAQAHPEVRITPPLYSAGDDLLLGPASGNRESLVSVQPLVVNLTYPEGFVFLPGKGAPLKIALRNPGDTPLQGSVMVCAPDGWQPDRREHMFSLQPREETVLGVNITAPGPQAVRTCTNFLDLRFRVNGICWTVSAGLPQSIPWLVAQTESFSDETATMHFHEVEAGGHTQTLAAGKYCLITEFKVPHDMTACYLAQARGEVELWLDDRRVLRHDSGFFVPAFHRHEGTGTEEFLGMGWHRARVQLRLADASPFYFGIGVSGRRTGGYVLDMEWRMPTIGQGREVLV